MAARVLARAPRTSLELESHLTGLGYLPATKTIEFKDSSREVELELKPVPSGGSRSYRGAASDRDKIINPGEVNIRPPAM